MRVGEVAPQIKRIELPEVFEPEEVPDYSRQEYLQRISRFRERLGARGLDFGVIYADREHSGNLNYFTGIFSPFEETVLVIARDSGEVYLLSGNEIVDGMVNLSPILDAMTPIRIQTFSLQGFFRELAYENKTLLKDSFKQIGIGKDSRVGLIGWKYFEEREIEDHLHQHFAPSVIVDCLRELASDRDVVNASDILLNPIDGMRIIHDTHQLAVIEANSTRLTNIVNRVFERVEPGMSEVDVARLIEFSGEHHLYYPIVCISAERIRLAYALPSTKYRLTEGEQLFVSLGFGGAAQAREGRFLEYGEAHQEAAFFQVYEQFFVLKYLWLKNLAIGKSGEEVYQQVQAAYDRDFIINPGHNIDQYQEWTNSVFRAGDESLLRSGMVFHIDVITETFNNDTIALASEELRQQLAQAYPAAWARINYRRQYLEDVIGLELHESVLPFSDNLLVQPFVRSLDYAFVNEAAYHSAKT
jgi:Xaa-Pro aminopeptidase